MTPRTTPKLSMKPLTATRSMRFVLALYSVRRTVLTSSSIDSLPLAWLPLGEMVVVREPLAETADVLPDLMSENDRRTSGESSASTCKALRAEEARR